jgi:hypothetical protein
MPPKPMLIPMSTPIAHSEIEPQAHEQITEEIKGEDLNSEEEDHLPDLFVLLKFFSCLSVFHLFPL